MPATRLFFITHDDRDGAALEQLAALVGHLDRERFSVDAAVLQPRGGGSRTVDRGSRDDMASAALLPNESPVRGSQPLVTIPLSERWAVDPRALWRLRRLVADERPDVVVTIGPAAVRYGGLAACLSGCGRLVIGWPGVDFDYCGAVASCFGRCMARRCERIVLASEAEREAAIAHGWPADRIAVVPMAATPRERTMDRKTVFAALGIAAASPVIGVVAPWRPRHRVKEAIWEFDLIRAMRDDVRMIVAGDGPWRAELELFREQQECQNAIRFVSPGKLPAEWVAHCDAIWSLDPALRVAHATLAATASGVPIVAVDTPGHRSFIAHGETGLLVPISVRPAAPQATLELLADAALRERIGAAAKRSMAERHGAAAVAAGLARLLESPTR